jgi:hypothetical protein
VKRCFTGVFLFGLSDLNDNFLVIFVPVWQKNAKITPGIQSYFIYLFQGE